MAELRKIYDETVNHDFECYDKRYELAHAESAKAIAAKAQASMRKALNTSRIRVETEWENPAVILLALPLDMPKATIHKLQTRLADYIAKSEYA